MGIIETLAGRRTASSETETQIKRSVISFFAKEPVEMEDFEFELLKAELLLPEQSIDADSSQLFHRKVKQSSAWTKTVSSKKKSSTLVFVVWKFRNALRDCSQ